jgi:peroxiredoxin Q/BCP
MKPGLLITAAFTFIFTTMTSMALEVGDAVPAFTATDDNGKEWSSSDHIGNHILVVYFYPADMTGGCTKQACGYRDKQDELAKKGIQVVGVSGDSVANHGHFKKAYNLNFPLLADEDGSVAKVFGVPTRAGGSITRTIDGEDVVLKRELSASRWTFVIDKSGKVIYKNSQVSPAEDADNILALEELK